MTQEVIVTKTCRRCGGSGKYSFNLKDMDRCYGCGGTGLVPCAPKGQKKIKPTAEDNKAIAGDIIEYAKVLYRVEEIRWLRPITKGYRLYNQQMKVIRLVDNQVFYIKREFHGIDPDNIVCWTINPDGSRTPAATVIHTPEHLVGTLYEAGQYGKEAYEPAN